MNVDKVLFMSNKIDSSFLKTQLSSRCKYFLLSYAVRTCYGICIYICICKPTCIIQSNTRYISTCRVYIIFSEQYVTHKILYILYFVNILAIVSSYERVINAVNQDVSHLQSYLLHLWIILVFFSTIKIWANK